MSAVYNNFKDIDGKTAFLAGVVSTLADQTLCEIVPRYWAVEADVFEADRDNLESSVKERMRIYDSTESKLTEDLHFEIEECTNDFEKIVHSLFDSYNEKHSNKESENIKYFLGGIYFQLGDIKAIYRLKKPLGEKCERCFSDYYTYIIFDIFFIQYSNYIVMVVFGSDE